MKKNILKWIAIFSLLIGMFLINSTNSYTRDYTNEDVKNKALQFLQNDWMNSIEISFEELEEEYLLPGNTLFNKEMEVRTEYFNLKAKDQIKERQKSLKDELVISKALEVTRKGEIFTVTGAAEIVYHYRAAGGKEGSVSTDASDIVLTFVLKEDKLYLIDLVDRTSAFFNKEFGINELSPEGEYTVPYGINMITEEKIPESISKNPEKKVEFEKLQLENIESSRKHLYERWSILTGEKVEPVEMESSELSVDRSSIHDLNRTNARYYARRWARTEPFCNSDKYVHIPTYFGGGFDCANFASQVLHEAGVPFTSEDLSKKGNANEWFALRNGTKYTNSWATANGLKNFILNNTRTYNRRGPIYWRGVWLNTSQDITLYPGDLIFLCDNGGTAKHTLICTDIGGKNRALYSAHSANELDESLIAKMKRSSYKKVAAYNLKYRR